VAGVRSITWGGNLDSVGKALFPSRCRPLPNFMTSEEGVEREIGQELRAAPWMVQEDRDFILDKARHATSAGSELRFFGPAPTPRP
jgi:hypothetical protein